MTWLSSRPLYVQLLRTHPLAQSLNDSARSISVLQATSANYLWIMLYLSAGFDLSVKVMYIKGLLRYFTVQLRKLHENCIKNSLQQLRRNWDVEPFEYNVWISLGDTKPSIQNTSYVCSLSVVLKRADTCRITLIMLSERTHWTDLLDYTHNFLHNFSSDLLFLLHLYTFL